MAKPNIYYAWHGDKKPGFVRVTFQAQYEYEIDSAIRTLETMRTLLRDDLPPIPRDHSLVAT